MAALPTKGASPTFQFSRPTGTPPWMMPASIASPTPMKHSTATTLMMANQYSASPKLRAENAFSPKVRARKATLHIQPGVSGNQ